MSSYKYQKRKGQNLAYISSTLKGVKCSPGKGGAYTCYYPRKGVNCPPNELNSGKCDARRWTLKSAKSGINDQNVLLRYYLDRARITFASGMAFRRKYSAYKLNQDGTIKLANRIGSLKDEFEWWNPVRRAKQDGYSPQNMEPKPKNNQPWPGKRYHYQGEALIRKANDYKLNAGSIFSARVNLFCNNDPNISKAFALALSKNELNALVKYVKNPNDYESIIKGLPTGRDRLTPINNINDVDTILRNLCGVQAPAPAPAIIIEASSRNQIPSRLAQSGNDPELFDYRLIRELTAEDLASFEFEGFEIEENPSL